MSFSIPHRGWTLRSSGALQVIKKHTNAHQKYVDKLLQEGVITDDEVREVHNRIQRILQEEYEMAKEHRVSEQEWLSSVWSGFSSPSQRSRIRNTGARTTQPLSREHVQLIAIDCVGPASNAFLVSAAGSGSLSPEDLVACRVCSGQRKVNCVERLL